MVSQGYSLAEAETSAFVENMDSHPILFIAGDSGRFNRQAANYEL
jgi:hypothetical protein